MSEKDNKVSPDFKNTHKQFNLEDLVQKKRGKKTTWYENTEGSVVAKVCIKCQSVKLFADFPKHNTGLGGREATCKICKAEATRKWYEVNREIALANDLKYNKKNRARRAELSRIWYDNNKERAAEYQRKWNEKNPGLRAVLGNRRRARKSALPDTLTHEEYSETLTFFGNACALTGKTENLEQEHAIPLSIGHGGTTFKNCFPMINGLNQSKYNHNVFEWFEANRQRFELSQERFDNLIAWLASANAMTVEEYRDYVYWCHANPRTVDEINNDNFKEESQ